MVQELDTRSVPRVRKGKRLMPIIAGVFNSKFHLKKTSPRFAGGFFTVRVKPLPTSLGLKALLNYHTRFPSVPFLAVFIKGPPRKCRPPGLEVKKAVIPEGFCRGSSAYVLFVVIHQCRHAGLERAARRVSSTYRHCRL